MSIIYDEILFNNWYVDHGLTLLQCLNTHPPAISTLVQMTGEMDIGVNRTLGDFDLVPTPYPQ